MHLFMLMLTAIAGRKRNIMLRVIRVSAMSSIALLSALATLAPAYASPAPLRALILSGRNNHDWKTTTPVIEKAFKECPRFGAVEITEAPEQLDPGAFANYDVIISNWTPYPQTKREWAEPLERAFLDFVRNGGGFVVLHAACCTFQEWPEFQQIVGLTWKEKWSSHTAYSPFEVNVSDKGHPIVRDMPNFFMVDELYQNLVTLSDAQPHVICEAFSDKAKNGTGKVEPVLTCQPFGKGRGVTCVLGHDAKAMRNVAFQTVVLRSAEWAATGEVTIPIPADWPSSATAASISGVNADEVLKAIATYKFGENRAPLVAVENLVRATDAMCEQSHDPGPRERLAVQLAAALTPEYSIEARQFICRQLASIGGEAQVPVLADLLQDEDLSFFARYALERIPGPAVDAALREALGKTSGKVRVGVINSLGVRRDPDAVPLLSSVLADADPDTAAATAASLGKIGGPDAANALDAFRGKAQGPLRQAVSDACAQCAETFAREGHAQEACDIYRALSSNDESLPTRRAALRGLVLAMNDAGIPLLLDALKNPDFESMAITLLREAPGASVVSAVSAELAALPSSVQANVIAALADRGDVAALPAISEAVSNADESVRVAALHALGALGGVSSVQALLDHARGSDAERDAAYASLAVLRGPGIDEALVAAMTGADAAFKCGLVKTLAARNAKDCISALAASASDEQPEVRVESWKAIQVLGRDQDLPGLVDLLMRARPEERESAEKAVIAVARRMDAGANRVEAVLAKLDPAPAPETRCSLLRVLGGVGDDHGLDTLREAAKGDQAGPRDVAVRALSAWPTPGPLDDLLDLAKSQQDEVLRVLALQGFVRLTAQVEGRTPESMTELLASALKLATRPEERRAALGELGKHPCPAAMDLAVASLPDQDVAGEAALAAIQIANALQGPDREQIKSGLRALARNAENPEVKDKAFAIWLKLENPPNLASGATASSPDDIEPDGASGPDRAAIDNNPDTYWDEQDNQPLYVLKLAFPHAVEISVVDVVGHPNEAYRAKNFDIVCDGTVVKEVREAHYDDNEVLVRVPKTHCEALELRIPGGNGLISPAIHELRVFDVDLD